MEGDKGCKKDKKRRSGAAKTLDLVLRSFHVGVTSVLFGGLILAVPFARLSLWHTLVIATGGVLILSEASRSRHWVYQVRGLVAITHVALLGLIHYRHDLLLPALTAVLATGVVGSNLPGYLRHWSIVHGERID